MAETKRDIRLQVFVTESMDDKLSDVAELMGMHKNEVVRMAIAMFCGSWNTSIDLVKDYVGKQIDGQVEIPKMLSELMGKSK